MTGKIIKDLNGEILRSIGAKSTTPHPDKSEKSLNTDSSTIEILVFDAIMTSIGSQLGHVAIDIDGAIYSRAHSKYAFLADGLSYRESNRKIRSFEALTLRVSQDEKSK